MGEKKLISTYQDQSFTAEEIAAIEQNLWGNAGGERSKRVVQLERLWKDIPFDVSTEDIREARRELSEALQRRIEQKQYGHT
jgi:hypothetical protein